LYVAPHNEILHKTVEIGIIGGVIFIMLMISVYRDALRLRRGSDYAKMFGGGMIAASLGIWLCSMINLPLSGSSGLIYWLLAGISIGLSNETGSNELQKNDDKDVVENEN
ncbi:MAG: hypothetical protein KAU36_06600, partial [candidate division Zixibacteria bacterium]|nr:hypothetical protein [candidate division Zixibacteria bacterium]